MPGCEGPETGPYTHFKHSNRQIDEYSSIKIPENIFKMDNFEIEMGTGVIRSRQIWPVNQQSHVQNNQINQNVVSFIVASY